VLGIDDDDSVDGEAEITEENGSVSVVST